MPTILNLQKRPKGVTIIEGFPGIGLIGTITTEFLLEHLKTEQIGSIIIDDVPAIVAVHGGRLVEPTSIHYNKEYNLVIIHSISMGHGVGWELARLVRQVADELKAKEIITIEGVGSTELTTTSSVFYYTTNGGRKKDLTKIVKPLTEGIIIGVTGALLAGAKETKVPITSFFAETHTNLPDSKSAATLIGVLDKYLGFDLDPKPLIKQAEQFEQKLRGIVEQAKQTTDIQKKKTLSYFG